MKRVLTFDDVKNLIPTREQLHDALDKEPTLCEYGFSSPPRGDDEIALVKSDSFYIRFCLSYVWLAHCDPTKTTFVRTGSYGLKHSVEEYFDHYIPNGAVIAAAIALGLRYKRGYPGSPNAVIGISKNSYDRMSNPAEKRYGGRNSTKETVKTGKEIINYIKQGNEV